MINGLQQIGIGVVELESRWRWYRNAFGMDVPIFDEAAKAPLMTRYTGGQVHSRRAVLALNMSGGAGFEIWQYTSRAPEPCAFDPSLGDLGLLAARMHCSSADAAREKVLGAGVRPAEEVECGPGGARPEEGGGATFFEPQSAPDGTEHFFVRDPVGLHFDLVPTGHRFAGSRPIGGLAGALIGVSDIETSLRFYGDLLGFDTVRYDETGTFEDLRPLPGGDLKVRRVLLERSAPPAGAFGALLGPPSLELIHAFDGRGRKIYEDRFWGDPGFIHLCFDIQNGEALKQRCAAHGFPFTVDSGESFDMGEAAGRFAYVEDPDGTLIEFVETHRIPILKKLGWYLDLKKRDGKPLPKPMVRLLGLGRVKE